MPRSRPRTRSNGGSAPRSTRSTRAAAWPTNAGATSSASSSAGTARVRASRRSRRTGTRTDRAIRALVVDPDVLARALDRRRRPGPHRRPRPARPGADRPLGPPRPAAHARPLHRGRPALLRRRLGRRDRRRPAGPVRHPRSAGMTAPVGPVLRRPTRRFGGYVFDLDGTLYLGDQLLPGAAETVAADPRRRRAGRVPHEQAARDARRLRRQAHRPRDPGRRAARSSRRRTRCCATSTATPGAPGSCRSPSRCSSACFATTVS